MPEHNHSASISSVGGHAHGIRRRLGYTNNKNEVSSWETGPAYNSLAEVPQASTESAGAFNKKGADTMRVFQILNDEVLIINDKKEYKDSVANFKTDSGLTVELPVKSIYDDLQKLPVIQYAGQPEDWKAYPVQELETYIDSVQTYLDAKEKREYVEPTEEEKVQAERQQLDNEYNSTKQQLADDLTTAILRGDTEAQANIQADYKDLEASYAESVSALNS